MTHRFPSNPFKIVDPKDFWKSFKKRFSEDFVTLNFEKMGFKVFEPFQDIGTDRVITKFVCYQCLGEIEKKDLRGDNLDDLDFEKIKSSEPTCKYCGSECEKITRVLQIKTRALKSKKNKKSWSTPYFGYTLRSKDFIPDPRIVFLLFSDHTIPYDFIIFSINDYLDFMLKAEYETNHFEMPTFKFDNGKINPIKYDKAQKLNDEDYTGGKWIFRHDNDHGRSKKKINISLQDYLNIKGLIRILKPEIQKNYLSNVKTIVDFRKKYFFKLASGDTFKNKKEELKIINEYIDQFLKSSQSQILKTFQNTTNKFNNLDPEIKLSIQQYEKDLYDSRDED